MMSILTKSKCKKNCVQQTVINLLFQQHGSHGATKQKLFLVEKFQCNSESSVRFEKQK